MFRTRFEASLLGPAGLQRLSRTRPNELSRVSLLPGEPVSPWPVTTVGWRDGHFALEVHPHPGLEVTRDGRTCAEGSSPLVHGDQFQIGQTLLRLEVKEERWPVDIEREALLADEDSAAWAVFTDQLLAQGDPLGRRLADPASAAFDVSMAIEVHPLIAERSLRVVADQRGLWSEVAFSFRPSEGALREGSFAAVLGHPLAWFVRTVRVELRPNSDSTPDIDIDHDYDDYDDEFDFDIDTIRVLAAEATRFIAQSAGPFLSRVVFPDLPAEIVIGFPRPTVVVER